MKVLLGLSGGVDSTYSIKKLRDMGCEVECAVLIMSEHTDVELARESANALDAKLNIIDARDDFEKYVINNFVSEYALARTPNPCVMCNKYVKISKLIDYAKENGFDKIATGHYVGVNEKNARYAIERGTDSYKDQSYVLWQLTQEQLSMLMTPLFDTNKNNVRKITEEMGLEASKRKDSQEICFIPDNDYASFIEKRVGKFPEGNFIDETGKILGTHKGIIHYTVGQRKRLGIALGEPRFITEINPADNTITLAKKGEEGCNRMTVCGLNFQRSEPFEGINSSFKVKVRYAAKPVSCSVNMKNGVAEVEFDEPVRAVTPGQSAVFYSENEIAFGGFIQKSAK